MNCIRRLVIAIGNTSSEVARSCVCCLLAKLQLFAGKGRSSASLSEVKPYREGARNSGSLSHPFQWNRHNWIVLPRWAELLLLWGKEGREGGGAVTGTGQERPRTNLLLWLDQQRWGWRVTLACHFIFMKIKRYCPFSMPAHFLFHVLFSARKWTDFLSCKLSVSLATNEWVMHFGKGVNTFRCTFSLVQKLCFWTLTLVALQVTVGMEVLSIGRANWRAVLRALVGELTKAFSLHTSFPRVTENFLTGLVCVLVA